MCFAKKDKILPTTHNRLTLMCVRCTFDVRIKSHQSHTYRRMGNSTMCRSPLTTHVRRTHQWVAIIIFEMFSESYRMWQWYVLVSGMYTRIYVRRSNAYVWFQCFLHICAFVLCVCHSVGQLVWLLNAFPFETLGKIQLSQLYVCFQRVIYDDWSIANNSYVVRHICRTHFKFKIQTTTTTTTEKNDFVVTNLFQLQTITPILPIISHAHMNTRQSKKTKNKIDKMLSFVFMTYHNILRLNWNWLCIRMFWDIHWALQAY